MATYFLVEGMKSGMFLIHDQVYRLNEDMIEQVLAHTRPWGWMRGDAKVCYRRTVLDDYKHREISESEVAMLMFEAAR